jgi:hypothetical protein
MPDTIRMRCLAAINTALEAMTAGEPADDPYTVQFSKVEHGPLGDTDHRKRYVAGIVPGRERKQTLYPFDQCTLEVAIEFRMMVNRDDDDPEVEAERLLGEIQRKLHEDTTLGGLAIDLRETGNEVDLEMYDDKSVVGVVFFDLLYRHRTTDPRLAA